MTPNVEPDGYVTFSWVHTFNPNTLAHGLSVLSLQRRRLQGGANDYPVISTVNQNANYVGGQTALNTTSGRTIFRPASTGLSSTNTTTSITYFTDGTPNVPASSIGVNGGVVSEFINDKFKVTPWFTLITGLRATQFNATISETATDPRFGGALTIPRLNWVFSGFYGYYYQAPPLVTATGPLLDLANGQDFTFAPLHGERDIQWQYGVTIPYRNWTLSASITMRPARRTGSTTTISANRISSGRSPGPMRSFKGGP